MVLSMDSKGVMFSVISSDSLILLNICNRLTTFSDNASVSDNILTKALTVSEDSGNSNVSFAHRIICINLCVLSDKASVSDSILTNDLTVPSNS